MPEEQTRLKTVSLSLDAWISVKWALFDRIGEMRNKMELWKADISNFPNAENNVKYYSNQIELLSQIVSEIEDQI